MSFRAVEQGIEAIQAGNRDEGVRMLKIALKSPELTGALRAVACLWLGEVSTDATEKRAYYKDALAADPTNAAVKQRVEAFLAQQFMPPTSTQTPKLRHPCPPAYPAQASHPALTSPSNRRCPKPAT